MVFYSTKQSVQPSKTILLPNYLTGGLKVKYIFLYITVACILSWHVIVCENHILASKKKTSHVQSCLLCFMNNITFFNFLISLFFFSCFLAFSVWRWRTWLGSKGRSIVFIPNCRAPRIWSNGSASGRTNTGKEMNQNQAVNFLSYTLYLYYWVLVSQYAPVQSVSPTNQMTMWKLKGVTLH